MAIKTPFSTGIFSIQLVRAGRLMLRPSRLWYTCLPHSSQPYASGEEKKGIMDLFHRKVEGKGKDTPTGRDCQFCHRVDPDFSKRDPMDRVVLSMLDDTAGAHLTEDGYVKHRIAELLNKQSLDGIETELAKSA
jgi:hypothetical protein